MSVMAPFWEWAHAHYYLAAGLVIVALLSVTKVICTFLRIFHSPSITNNVHHHHLAASAPEGPETEDSDEAPELDDELDDELDEEELRPTLDEPAKQEVPVRRRSRFDRIRSSRT